MTTKNSFRRGFTLIELMIVIVILGILMGTVLPRLTGAQSRARDTARIADLNNISQALEVYFSDFGKYPDEKCSGIAGNYCGGGASADVVNCLDDAASAGAAGDIDPTDTYNVLKGYMKGDRVPQNVGVKTNTMGCVGSYWYSPLKKGGTPNASYVLASDLETWQMANFNLNTDLIDSETSFTKTREATLYIPKIGKLASEPVVTGTTDADELASIYIVIP